jgi:hypothetical protein
MPENNWKTTTCGYQPGRWNSAKEKLRARLWRQAIQSVPLTYGDAAQEIKDLIAFDPHDHIFHIMLGQISVEEDAAGRGLLSALVVYQDDGWPGPGFFDLAHEYGREVHQKERCWIEEVNRLAGEAKRR